MKDILRKIVDILYYVPNMNRDTMGSIINPIETEEEANRLLKYLQDNKEQLKTGYLIKHKIEIIKSK